MKFKIGDKVVLESKWNDPIYGFVDDITGEKYRVRFGNLENEFFWAIEAKIKLDLKYYRDIKIDNILK
jgi:hypothetical protein